MSYSLTTSCWKCTKSNKCIDSTIVQGAIMTIHSLYPAQEKGHLGAGVITIDCNRLEPKETEEVVNNDK